MEENPQTAPPYFPLMRYVAQYWHIFTQESQPDGQRPECGIIPPSQYTSGYAIKYEIATGCIISLSKQTEVGLEVVTFPTDQNPHLTVEKRNIATPGK